MVRERRSIPGHDDYNRFLFVDSFLCWFKTIVHCKPVCCHCLARTNHATLSPFPAKPTHDSAWLCHHHCSCSRPPKLLTAHSNTTLIGTQQHHNLSTQSHQSGEKYGLRSEPLVRSALAIVHPVSDPSLSD